MFGSESERLYNRLFLTKGLRWVIFVQLSSTGIFFEKWPQKPRLFNFKIPVQVQASY